MLTPIDYDEFVSRCTVSPPTYSRRGKDWNSTCVYPTDADGISVRINGASNKKEAAQEDALRVAYTTYLARIESKNHVDQYEGKRLELSVAIQTTIEGTGYELEGVDLGREGFYIRMESPYKSGVTYRFLSFAIPLDSEVDEVVAAFTERKDVMTAKFQFNDVRHHTTELARRMTDLFAQQYPLQDLSEADVNDVLVTPRGYVYNIVSISPTRSKIVVSVLQKDGGYEERRLAKHEHEEQYHIVRDAMGVPAIEYVNRYMDLFDEMRTLFLLTDKRWYFEWQADKPLEVGSESSDE